MKPAALLCFALALTAGAQGPDRDFPSDLRVRGYLSDETALTYLANLYYQMGGAEANYAGKVDLLDRAAALYNRVADVRLGALAWLSL